MKELIEAIGCIETAINDLPDTITIDFSVDTYNLVSSIYDQQDRIAAALERIASIMEKQNA